MSEPVATRAVAFPIVSAGMRSPMEPPSKAAGVIPAQPDKNRKAMNMPMFTLEAHPAVKARKRKFETLYIIALP